MLYKKTMESRKVLVNRLEELTGSRAVYWTTNGNYLPSDCVEVLKHTDLSFSPEATQNARNIQTAMALERYSHTTTDEERVEMGAAFGEGTTIVNIITGERIRL